MTNIRYVNGPYVKKGRRFIVITFDDGTQKTTAHAKYVVEQALGRDLLPDETVDHIDGDPLNDHVNNLQLLSLADNVRKSAVELIYKFNCPFCNKGTEKRGSRVLSNWNLKKYKRGPYCSQSCSRQAESKGDLFQSNGQFININPYNYVEKPITQEFNVDVNFVPFYPRYEKNSENNRSYSSKLSSESIIDLPGVNIAHCAYCQKRCRNDTYWHADCLTCIDCDEKVTTLRCRKHAGLMQDTKIAWPDEEDLIKMLKESNYSKVGRELGVSDNAVRTRIKRRGYDPKTLIKKEV